MKLVWDDDEVAPGFPVENPLITKDESGKIISVAWIAYFGADNATANKMNMDLLDGDQSVVKLWSEAKVGPAPTVGGGPKKG